MSRAGEILFTTRINVTEILVGTYRGTDLPTEQMRIALILRAVAVLDLDEHSADRFAQIKAAGLSNGRPVGNADLFIAAIALANGCSMLTRNTRNFLGIAGLEVEGY